MDNLDGTNFNLMSWNEELQRWGCVFGPMGARAPRREQVEEYITEHSELPLDQWDFKEDDRGWFPEAGC